MNTQARKVGIPVVACYKFNGKSKIIYGKLHSIDGASWMTVEVESWNAGKKQFDFVPCRKYNVQECTQDELSFYNKQLEGLANELALIK